MSNWRNRARCADSSTPDLWFPIGNTGTDLPQVEKAKAECEKCPVSRACLAWAIETGQEHGVWGGLTKDERRLYKRREGLHGGPRHKAPCGTIAAYRRHSRNGQTPCFPCGEANRLEQQRKTEARKAAAA